MSEKNIVTLSQQLEYWLQLPPKTVLQAKLHKEIEEATTQVEIGGWG